MRFFGIVSSFILAIPFYYLWNYLAPIYLPNIPEVYQAIPFWHCVGVFILIGIIKSLITPRHHHGMMMFGGRRHCKRW